MTGLTARFPLQRLAKRVAPPLRPPLCLIHPSAPVGLNPLLAGPWRGRLACLPWQLRSSLPNARENCAVQPA